MTAPVKDSGAIVPVGRLVDFQPRILRDGAALSLAGKTVTATIRRESAPDTPLTGFTDLACTLGNDTYTAAEGGLQLQQELTSVFTVPGNPRESYAYLVEFYIVDDDYSPQKLRFGVTRSFHS